MDTFGNALNRKSVETRRRKKLEIESVFNYNEIRLDGMRGHHGIRRRRGRYKMRRT